MLLSQLIWWHFLPDFFGYSTISSEWGCLPYLSFKYFNLYASSTINILIWEDTLLKSNFFDRVCREVSLLSSNTSWVWSDSRISSETLSWLPSIGFTKLNSQFSPFKEFTSIAQFSSENKFFEVTLWFGDFSFKSLKSAIMALLISLLSISEISGWFEHHSSNSELIGVESTLLFLSEIA